MTDYNQAYLGRAALKIYHYDFVTGKTSLLTTYQTDGTSVYRSLRLSDDGASLQVIQMTGVENMAVVHVLAPKEIDVEGKYSYYVDVDGLHIRRKDTSVQLIVAWYDGSKLAGTAVIPDTQLHEYPIPAGQSVKIMALNAYLAPQCAATTP